MPISSVCANGHSFQVRDDLLGKKVRCPQCSAVTLVGANPAGAAPKPAGKGKATNSDPWEMDDPFEGEEAPARPSAARGEQRPVSRSSATPRKKRSSKSSGNSSSTGLLIGLVAGVVVIGGGLWLWLGRATGPAAPAEPVAASTVVPTPGTPMSTPALPAPGATAQVPPPAPSALAQEVAALPFPPMTDPRYGPPAPNGLVVSRAILNATTEMLLTAMRRDGNPGPPPDQLVTNVVTIVAKQRTDDPFLCCVPAAVEAALLAGTPDMASLRQDFNATLAQMEPAGAELPAVVTAYLPAHAKNELSGGMTAFLTGLMQAKMRKVKSSPPKAAGQSAAPPNAAAPPPMAAAASAPAPSVPAFLDQKKTVRGGLEWSREVTLRKPGALRMRISSTQRFSVLVMSDKAYKGAMNNRPDQVTRDEIHFDADPRTESLEQTVTLPAGSTWVMIKNESGSEAEIHLECFPG
jgi:hypothetical protein